jgi:hypothetical protein
VQVKLMDSEDGLEPILISSEEAIVLLTLDCNTIKDLQMYLRQMVEANSRSPIPVRVCTHFYPGVYNIQCLSSWKTWNSILWQ